MGRKKKELIQETEEKIEETVKEIGEKITEKAEEIKEGVEKFIKDAGKNIETKKKRGKKKEEKIKAEEGKKGKKKKEEKTDKIKEIKITKKELEEKAKKLAEKIKTEDIKERLEEEREKDRLKGKTLVSIEEYVKAGVHVGTKVITPHMRIYVYRRRNDGIAIINTNFIDQKIKQAVDLLKEYAPENFIVVCKREAGWKPVKKFSELTGVRAFTKKYPAGILTNIKLPSFFETELIFICDPWLDKNALRDAKKIKKKVFALCDTNNYAFDVNFVIPCNNKSNKSLGLIFYLITREYLKARGIKKEVKIEDFVEEEAES